MDKCPRCDVWWEVCPSCGDMFCPDCHMTEAEAWDEEGTEE